MSNIAIRLVGISNIEMMLAGELDNLDMWVEEYSADDFLEKCNENTDETKTI